MTMSEQPLLLAVVEFLAHNRLRAVYEAAGYRVQSEFAVRKAITWLRRNRPAVVAADFYHQPDFRDRVSNVESLLATVQSMPEVKVVVYYDPAHQAALDKVAQRFRIDAALPVPVRDEALRALLEVWKDA
jgi:predicted RNase H-like nuclease (RuvC/YqgF family)